MLHCISPPFRKIDWAQIFLAMWTWKCLHHPILAYHMEILFAFARLLHFGGATIQSDLMRIATMILSSIHWPVLQVMNKIQRHQVCYAFVSSTPMVARSLIGSRVSFRATSRENMTKILSILMKRHRIGSPFPMDLPFQSLAVSLLIIMVILFCCRHTFFTYYHTTNSTGYLHSYYISRITKPPSCYLQSDIREGMNNRHKRSVSKIPLEVRLHWCKCFFDWIEVWWIWWQKMKVAT